MPRQNGVGHDNRAGVDKGIVRDTAIVLELNDGIEGRTRRLAPNAPPKNIAHLPERHGEGEDFQILWIEKLSSASPAVKTAPSMPATAMPSLLGSNLLSSGM